jgi:hypothetical protein
MLEALERVGRFLRWVLGAVRPPLKVEVTAVVLERISRDGPLVVITTCPVRYQAAIRIINRDARPVFIRDVRLHVPHGALSPESLSLKRLDPDDYADADVIFPVINDDVSVETGKFTIEVIPTRGRTTRTSGRFPWPDQSP